MLCPDGESTLKTVHTCINKLNKLQDQVGIQKTAKGKSCANPVKIFC